MRYQSHRRVGSLAEELRGEQSKTPLGHLKNRTTSTGGIASRKAKSGTGTAKEKSVMLSIIYKPGTVSITVSGGFSAKQIFLYLHVI